MPRRRDEERRVINQPLPAAASRLLLVDDDPAVLDSLQFALELEGFTVDAFASAEKLMADPKGLRHDIMVLDYRLPGIDGLSLLDQLRKRGENCPAVIITSNPTRALRHRTAQAGAILIEKPLLTDSLSSAIRDLIANEA